MSPQQRIEGQNKSLGPPPCTCWEVLDTLESLPYLSRAQNQMLQAWSQPQAAWRQSGKARQLFLKQKCEVFLKQNRQQGWSYTPQEFKTVVSNSRLLGLHPESRAFCTYSHMYFPGYSSRHLPESKGPSNGDKFRNHSLRASTSMVTSPGLYCISTKKQFYTAGSGNHVARRLGFIQVLTLQLNWLGDLG